MLTLILALVVAEPAASTAPAAAPAPQPAPKVAKSEKVTCKWIAGSGGTARQVCATDKQWRNEQMERQQRVDEFQRRALTTGVPR
jgi:hypothetical protein